MQPTGEKMRVKNHGQKALDQHSCRFQVAASNGESAYSPGIGREASSYPTSYHGKKTSYLRARGSAQSSLGKEPASCLGMLWVGRDCVSHSNGQISKTKFLGQGKLPKGKKRRCTVVTKRGRHEFRATETCICLGIHFITIDRKECSVYKFLLCKTIKIFQMLLFRLTYTFHLFISLIPIIFRLVSHSSQLEKI